MNNDLVSVCITTYNRKEILPNALRSVVNQTYFNLEIIILDDHSTDGTKKLIENELLNIDDRIIYIRNPVNKGLAASRNIAIDRCKGKYISFIDDDDKWEMDFVESFIKVAQNYDDKWCFCCGVKIIKNSRRIVNLIPRFDGSLTDYVKAGFTPPVSSQFYYVSTLRKISGYDERIKSGVDHDIWIRLAHHKINIKSIEKSLSIPNTSLSDRRMTTDIDLRISGINNSLAIWKKTLVEMYGEKYYYKFFQSYIDREKMKFCINQIYQWRFRDCLVFARKNDIPYVSLFKQFIRVIIIKIVSASHIENGKTKNEYKLMAPVIKMDH